MGYLDYGPFWFAAIALLATALILVVHIYYRRVDSRPVSRNRYAREYEPDRWFNVEWED